MATEAATDNIARQSIGNYKGVMLCNRPNENQIGKLEKGASNTFVSRVDNKVPLGWNPIKKDIDMLIKKKRPLSAIKKHRDFLKELKQKKAKEAEDVEKTALKNSNKKNKIKKKAEIQRKKVKDWKNELNIIDKALGPEVPKQPEVEVIEKHPKAQLTAENLQKIADKQETEIKQKEEPKEIKKPESEKSNKAEQSIPKSKDSKREEKKKPLWALSEKQVEDLEDKEAENLIQFAYELDYEKYMEDFEVKQALESIRKRVNEINVSKEKKDTILEEIKKDDEDKQEKKNLQKEEAKKEEKLAQLETKSHQSKKSVKSLAESVRDEVLSQQKPDWNKSVKGNEENTIEDKIASKLADQVLANAPNLKGIHSKQSIRKILEAEAKQGMAPTNPKIVVVKEKGAQQLNPSNLPYLHRNEAV